MLQNLHSHTTLCDGKNTPQEMIESAIELGFDSYGFSGHAKTIQNTGWEIKCSADEYVAKLNEIKKNYADRIKVYVGAELDYFSAGVMPTDALDYTIGSVHMTFKNGNKIDYDHSYDSSKRHIDTDYCGEWFEYARDYYEKVADMPNVVDYDIVGHFDLLTKFSERHPDLIDIESKQYKHLALDALYAVRKKRELFEVNTGAISRGHRTTPYPAPFILDEMNALNCKLVLTSDCHSRDSIDCNFNEAKQYIKAHGFDTLYFLTENGFIGEKI